MLQIVVGRDTTEGPERFGQPGVESKTKKQNKTKKPKTKNQTKSNQTKTRTGLMDNWRTNMEV